MPYDDMGQWYDDYGGEESYLSPWEQAHGGVPYDPNNTEQNAENDFDRATAEYYNNTSPEAQAEHNNTNWYQPETYAWLTNTPGGGADLGNDFGGIPEPPPPPPRPPTPPPSPNSPRNSGDSGGGGRTGNLNYFGDLGNIFGGPGSPGVFEDPVQQVGQEPMSKAITGGLMDMIANYGQTPLGSDMEATLRGLIERRGEVEDDPSLRAQRMEAKRQPIEAFRRMQTNQMRGELANRSLISEPGMPQGSEIGALGRFEERLAPYYATAGQELASEDARANNDRLSQAITLATGLSQSQSQQMLATLHEGTDRQRVLSEIALGTLDRNIIWNKFLAELGLERAKVMYQIQQGRVDSIAPILAMFQQYLNSASGGYV